MWQQLKLRNWYLVRTGYVFFVSLQLPLFSVVFCWAYSSYYRGHKLGSLGTWVCDSWIRFKYLIILALCFVLCHTMLFNFQRIRYKLASLELKVNHCLPSSSLSPGVNLNIFAHHSGCSIHFTHMSWLWTCARTAPCSLVNPPSYTLSSKILSIIHHLAETSFSLQWLLQLPIIFLITDLIKQTFCS